MPILSRWKILKIIREVIALVMEPEKMGKAPEGKLKGKGSDRKAASLTLPIRAETSPLRKEREGAKQEKKKKKSVTKPEFCPGEMLTPRLVENRRKWQQLHCRSEFTAATGEVASRRTTTVETAVNGG